MMSRRRSDESDWPEPTASDLDLIAAEDDALRQAITELDAEIAALPPDQPPLLAILASDHPAPVPAPGPSETRVHTARPVCSTSHRHPAAPAPLGARPRRRSR